MNLIDRLSNILKLLNGEDYLRDRNAEKQDVWIGSLPTLLPGDDNLNPIKFRMNENGDAEYYRKAKD